ncbi:hypothetical protein AOLI_G00039470 [Acnodon oligacanthus]
MMTSLVKAFLPGIHMSCTQVQVHHCSSERAFCLGFIWLLILLWQISDGTQWLLKKLAFPPAPLPTRVPAFPAAPPALTLPCPSSSKLRTGSIVCPTAPSCDDVISSPYASTGELLSSTCCLASRNLNIISSVVLEIEAEADLHKKDADSNHLLGGDETTEATLTEAEAEAIEYLMLVINNIEAELLENERLEKAAAEAEAQAIQDQMNILLDEADESVQNRLAGDETTEVLLTEAEVEALKNMMLEFIDDLEAELLGRDVMSAADEVEASTHTLQTHLDETHPANDQPLAEIETTKKDSPENVTKKDQAKKKTRRGTRGKGRKINYKK